MRIVGWTTLATAALLACPAFAQSSPGNLHSTNPAGVANPSQTPQQLTQETRHRIRQSLEQAGFKDIRVMPEAFLIRAQAPDGSRIVMQVGPDQFAALIQPGNASAGSNATGATGTASSAGQSGSTSAPGQSGSTSASGEQANMQNSNASQQIRQALEHNGFKNVQVMPEAFAIRAQAPDGARMVMVVTPDQAEGIIAQPTGSGSSGGGSTATPGSGSPNR